MRVLLFFIFFITFGFGYAELLENSCLKISVSLDGTIGNGRIPPGIQFDKDCNNNFNDNRDYLTPEIPYEYYSLKYNNIIYFANNGITKDRKKIIYYGLERFDINKSNNTIYATAYTQDGKFKIEHIYKLEDKKINITTKITNLTNQTLKNIYFARGLDPDIDNLGDKNGSKTENIRGYNGSNPKDFIYSKSVNSGSPIGLYSTSEIPHNTSVYTFKDKYELTSMDAEALFKGVEKGERIDDSIINIAFKIKQLNPNETKILKYKYVCSSDIKKSVIIKSLIIDADKDIFVIPYTTNVKYELAKSIPTFRVNSTNISSITFTMKITGIPDGVKLKIADKIFDKNNNIQEISLNCNQDYNVEVYRNRDFKENTQFTINFKAGKIKDNIAQWFGNDEFSLTFKPKIVKSSFVSLIDYKKSFLIPYTKNQKYELAQSIPAFKISSSSASSITFAMNIIGIPDGVKLKIGNKIFDNTNNTQEINLNCNQNYNVEIYRNKDFKEVTPFIINFKAGKINDNVTQWVGNNRFSLTLKPKILKSNIHIQPKIIKIPYSWDKEYKKVAVTNFVLTNFERKKTFNNNIMLELKNIPEGIKIKIKSKVFTKKVPKHSLMVDSYKKYNINIYRNREFKKDNDFKIDFIGVSNNKEFKLTKNRFSISFKPVARNIILQPSTNKLVMPINKIAGVIDFIVYDNKRKIKNEELKAIKLTTNLKLKNYQIEYKQDRIELKFISKKRFCIPPKIKIGKRVVDFTIQTPYPNETQTKTLVIEIKDVSFWEKWGCLIILIFSILLFLILIYGYLKKNRFCKNSHIRIEREGRKPYSIYFKSKVSFLSKLIPFKDEKISIEGITFKASGRCGVIISKDAQSRNLNIDGEELGDMAGKRDIRLVSGTVIYKRNKVLRFIA